MMWVLPFLEQGTKVQLASILICISAGIKRKEIWGGGDYVLMKKKEHEEIYIQ